MTEATHTELDRICTEICENLCHWPYAVKDQEEMDDRCACCQTLLDLASLVEKLEARIPPEEGETVYCVQADCDHCPYPDANAYRHCQHCRLFVAVAEPFNKSEHLEDFYDRRVFRNKDDAEKKAKEWREELGSPEKEERGGKDV